MIGTIDIQWWSLLVVAGGLYVMLCVRVARRVGATGRSTAKWFFITFAFTAIPAAVLLMRIARDNKKGKTARQAPGRCRHCGGLIVQDESAERLCPNCGMKMDEDNLA